MFGFLKRGNDPKSRTNTGETSADSATPSSTNGGHSRQTSEGQTPRSSLANPPPPPHPNNASFPSSQPAAAAAAPTAYATHPSHKPSSDPTTSHPYPPANNNTYTSFQNQHHQHHLEPTVRWVLADDILAQRYAPPLTHLQGQWQPLTTTITSSSSSSSSSSSDSDAWTYLHCQYMSIPTSSNKINNTNSGGDSYQQHNNNSKNKSTTSHTLPVWQSLMLGKNSAALVPRGSGGGRGWGYNSGGGGNNSNNAASTLQLRGTRPRQLFQYKPYIQQAPLELTEMEIIAVIESVLGPVDDASNSVFQRSGGRSRANDDALERELWGGESAGGVNNINSNQQQQQQQRKKLNTHAPAGEAAAVILIKLVIDTYLRSGPGAAFPQIMAMFQEALIKNAPSAKKRIFDVIFNVSIHGELLYTSAGGAGGGGGGNGGGDDMPYASAAEMAAAEASLLGNAGNTDMSNMNWHATVTSAFRTALVASLSTTAAGGGGVYNSDRKNNNNIPRIRIAPDQQQQQQQHDYLPPGSGDNTPTHGAFSEWPPLKPKDLPPFAINTEIKLKTERFRQWLRLILFRLIALLPDLAEEEEEEEKEQGLAGNTGAKGGGGGLDEATWIAAFSSLVHLSTHQGKVVRGYVDQLPLHGVAGLLQAARRYRWDEHVQSWLIGLAMNLLYVPPEPGNNNSSSTGTSGGGGGGGGGGDKQHHRKRSSSSGGESLRAMTSQTLQQQSNWAAVGGGGGGLAGGGLPSSSSSFWGSALIDRQRLADFGGVPAVIACYKTAPTAAARKNTFSVLFDLAVCGEDVLSLISTTDPLLSFSTSTTHHHYKGPPPLTPRAHSSEVAALGSALFQLGLDQHIQPLFTAGLTGIIPHMAGPLSVRMAAMQEMNPGRVVAVAPQFVADVLDCLDDMIDVDVSVPAELDVAVQQTLQSIIGGGGTVSIVEGGWECLDDCFIGNSSTFSSSIACNWLQKLLIVHAEMQVLSLTNNNNKKGDDGDYSEAAAACLTLLPDFIGTSQTNIKNTGTSRLSKMISTLLETTSSSTRANSDSDRKGGGGGGRGTVCFAQAVTGLLAYIQMRCSGLERIGEDSPSPLGKRQTHNSGISGTNGTTTPLVTPLTTPTTSGTAAAAAAVPSPLLLDSPSLVFEGADGTSSGITLTSPLGDGDASSSSIASSEAWSRVNGGKSMIATLCEAVRWLEGQGRGRGKGNALLSLSKTLLDMVSIPVDVVNDIEKSLTAERRQQQQMFAASSASMHHQQQEGDTSMLTTKKKKKKKTSLSVQIPGGDDGGGGTTTTNNNTNNATTSLTPLSAAIKNSARRSSLMGTPVAGGTGLGLGPATGTAGNTQWFSPASAAASTPYQTPAQSFNSSIFKFPVPTATAGASININRTSFGGGNGNASPGMVTPRTRLTVGGNNTSANNSPFLSISNLITGGGGGGGNTSAAATPQQQQALNYATTTAGAGAIPQQHQQQQQPGAPPHLGGSTTSTLIPSSDEHTLLDGFLSGCRVIPLSMLHIIPITTLKVLFSEMDMLLKLATPPATSSGQSSSALAVNTCQPVWDVRLALLLVLMARCIKPTTTNTNGNDGSNRDDDEAETVFFSSLLDDADGRVRQYASVFVLRRLMQRQPVKYREALRFVGIRAQQAGEERLVCSPWLQLKAMLEHRLVDF